jgi:hypothetical protein
MDSLNREASLECPELKIRRQNLPERFEDLVGGFRPDEGLGMTVVEVDIAADGVLELVSAAVHAAPQLFFGQRRKLNHLVIPAQDKCITPQNYVGVTADRPAPLPDWIMVG